MEDTPHPATAKGPQTASGKRKPRGRPFVPNDPRSGHFKPKAGTSPAEGESGDHGPPGEPPDLYAAMCHVANGGKATTPLQKSCAAWLKRNAATFMARMADLKIAAAKEEVPPGASSPDRGTEKVLALIEKLLADANEDCSRDEYERLKKKYEGGEYERLKKKYGNAVGAP